MRSALLLFLPALLCNGVAVAADGLITRSSRDGPAQTLARLEASIQAHGLTIFARIDHAQGAKEAGLALEPTEVVIFGSVKAGTPLMQMSPTIAIDLPLKMLIWLDANGKTLVAFNDPLWLAKRHGLGKAADPVLAKMQAALAAIAGEAAGAP